MLDSPLCVLYFFSPVFYLSVTCWYNPCLRLCLLWQLSSVSFVAVTSVINNHLLIHSPTAVSLITICLDSPISLCTALLGVSSRKYDRKIVTSGWSVRTFWLCYSYRILREGSTLPHSWIYTSRTRDCMIYQPESLGGTYCKWEAFQLLLSLMYAINIYSALPTRSVLNGVCYYSTNALNLFPSPYLLLHKFFPVFQAWDYSS